MEYMKRAPVMGIVNNTHSKDKNVGKPELIMSQKWASWTLIMSDRSTCRGQHGNIPHFPQGHSEIAWNSSMFARTGGVLKASLCMLAWVD